MHKVSPQADQIEQQLKFLFGVPQEKIETARAVRAALIKSLRAPEGTATASWIACLREQYGKSIINNPEALMEIKIPTELQTEKNYLLEYTACFEGAEKENYPQEAVDTCINTISSLIDEKNLEQLTTALKTTLNYLHLTLRKGTEITKTQEIIRQLSFEILSKSLFPDTEENIRQILFEYISITSKRSQKLQALKATIDNSSKIVDLETLLIPYKEYLEILWEIKARPVNLDNPSKVKQIKKRPQAKKIQKKGISAHPLNSHTNNHVSSLAKSHERDQPYWWQKYDNY